MSYSPNIPSKGAAIKSQYQAIQRNFTVLNDVFGENHVNYTDTTTADQGKHNKLDFPRQSSAPTANATAALLYAAIGSGGASELFFGKDSGSNSQWTNTNAGAATNPAGTNLSSPVLFTWQFVDGLLLKMGTFTATSPTSTFTFNLGAMPIIYWGCVNRIVSGAIVPNLSFSPNASTATFSGNGSGLQNYRFIVVGA